MRTLENEDRRPGASCWSCKGPVADGAPFCAVCGAIQPPGQADHFVRLRLEPAFDLDGEELDRRYFEMQRLLHPDRFATKAPSEKALSQQQATSLNEAYETLKDPLSRADYLIGLEGGGTAEGSDHDVQLLQESLEMREALAEAETMEAIDALARRAADDIETCLAELSARFADADLEGAGRQAVRLKYLRKLAEETRLGKARMAG
ncbi:MAG: Fe-S protein assembly co-chaperone HscB [Proteobacteria bacterium]|nr:Fe-S protein assembly co-chaperone HscB [Pseudomonadota bacterium]